MARTKGALSKSKFINVRLSELNKLFLPDTIIKVDKNYEFLLKKEDVCEIIEPPAAPKTDKLKIEVIKFQ
jgi:hypothetical protein